MRETRSSTSCDLVTLSRSTYAPYAEAHDAGPFRLFLEHVIRAIVQLQSRVDPLTQLVSTTCKIILVSIFICE